MIKIKKDFEKTKENQELFQVKINKRRKITSQIKTNIL
jgi:hypothetical protein